MIHVPAPSLSSDVLSKFNPTPCCGGAAVPSKENRLKCFRLSELHAPGFQKVGARAIHASTLFIFACIPDLSAHDAMIK